MGRSGTIAPLQEEELHAIQVEENIVAMPCCCSVHGEGRVGCKLCALVMYLICSCPRGYNQADCAPCAVVPHGTCMDAAAVEHRALVNVSGGTFML